MTLTPPTGGALFWKEFLGGGRGWSAEGACGTTASGAGTSCSFTRGRGLVVNVRFEAPSGKGGDWTGVCGTGVSGLVSVSPQGICDITISGNWTVGVTLRDPKVTISPQPVNGYIWGNDFECGDYSRATYTKCSRSVPAGTKLHLWNWPITGYVVTGWTGDCPATERDCDLTVNRDVTLSVNYKSTQTSMLTMTKPAAGGQIVANGDAMCGNKCSLAQNTGGTAVFVAAPELGWVFDKWGGDCAGDQDNSCRIAVNGDKAVSVTFRQVGASTLTISPKPVGGYVWTIGANYDNEISCGDYSGATYSACSVTMTNGSSMTLESLAALGYVAAGWTGNCQPSASSTRCVFTLNKNETLNYSFTKR